MMALEVNIAQRLKRRQLALQADPSVTKTGLADLAEKYLGVHVDKSKRTDDWSINPLVWGMVVYAAVDALVSRLLTRILFRRATRQDDSIVVPPEYLQVGKEVTISSYSKQVAKGVITMIGGERGVATKWGTKLIGKGIALIKLDEVMVPGTRPPFDFKHASDPALSWSRKNVSFGDLIKSGANAIVAVRTSSLSVVIPVLESDEEEGKINFEGEINFAAEGLSIEVQEAPKHPTADTAVVHPTPLITIGNSLGGVDPTATAGVDGNSTRNGTNDEGINEKEYGDVIEALYGDILELDDKDANEIDGNRSRVKSDWWHDLHSLPMASTVIVKSLVKGKQARGKDFRHTQSDEKQQHLQ
jgi:hypothetical protein